MSLFAAAARAAAATNDLFFAGRVTVTPMLAAGQYKAAEVDPGRPAFDIKAPFVAKDELQTTAGATRDNDFKGQMAVGDAWVTIRPEQLGERRLKKGDRITVHDRPEEDRDFAVEYAGPADSLGRIRFYLTRVAAVRP